jgi:hypothetical protein
MIIKNVKISEKNRQFPVLKVLNSFSPRSFSFTILAKKEGSTNPFFRLLDSFDKNARIP